MLLLSAKQIVALHLNDNDYHLLDLFTLID